MTATWVFGYGSLVNRASLGLTIGRPVEMTEGWSEAELSGWGRRWNYGISHVRGEWTDADGMVREVTIVALGVVAAPDESANGVVVLVADDELERLDHRERHYDRVDVTEQVTAAGERLDRVVTYVPRPYAVEHYERARDAGSAAIEQRYWDLVDGAFGTLGADRRDRYRATTPPPDVPVLPVRRV